MPTTALSSPRARRRDALVHANLGLVHFLARRLHGTLADEAELDELVSAGLSGLLRAAENFDDSRGHAFSTFATARIRGAMLDELRRLDPLSRTMRARTRNIQLAACRLAQRLGREPQPHEIASVAGISLRDYWHWERELHAAKQLPIDADAEEIREPSSLGERIPAPDFDLDVEIDREREREWLRDIIDQLPTTERQVITLSYFENLTLEAIAARLGITESGVSRIRTRALTKLRRLAAEQLPSLPAAA